MNDDLPPTTHNLPPDPLAPLQERTTELVQTGNLWVSERPEITEDTIEPAQQFTVQVRKHKQAVEKSRKDINKGFKELKDANDAAHAAVMRPLEIILEKLQPAMLAYTERVEAARKEEARKAQEEADRIAREAREAEEKAAAASKTAIDDQMKAEQLEADRKAAEKTAALATRNTKAPVARNTTGQTTFVRDNFVPVITDWDALQLPPLKKYLMQDRAAIEKAIRAYIKDGHQTEHEMPGFKVVNNKTVITR